jgi:hypothetical protein
LKVGSTEHKEQKPHLIVFSCPAAAWLAPIGAEQEQSMTTSAMLRCLCSLGSICMLHPMPHATGPVIHRKCIGKLANMPYLCHPHLWLCSACDIPVSSITMHGLLCAVVCGVANGAGTPASTFLSSYATGTKAAVAQTLGVPTRYIKRIHK